MVINSQKMIKFSQIFKKMKYFFVLKFPFLTESWGKVKLYYSLDPLNRTKLDLGQIKTYACLMRSFFNVACFFNPIISIQIAKITKSTPRLDSQKKKLEPQNFFIFSIMRPSYSLHIKNPNS